MDEHAASGAVPSRAAPELPDWIMASWREALDLWGIAIDLRPPRAAGQGAGAAAWRGDDPLAWIEMESRQVHVNFQLLVRIDALESLTAVFAHEIGHHVAFPHTLRQLADITLLQRRVFPGQPVSVINQFYDLLVNEAIGRQLNPATGRTRALEMAAVYRGISAMPGYELGSVGTFYLAIYEELWGLPPGDLLGGAAPPEMDAWFPAWRAEARVVAQTLYALEGVPLQFLYFASRLLRYFANDETGRDGMRIALGRDLPAADDNAISGAIFGSADVDRAVAEAVARGYLRPEEAGTSARDAPLANVSRLLEERGDAAFRRRLVGLVYGRWVARHLFALPEIDTDEAPDLFLPTTVTAWEPGDDLGGIDWGQSVLRYGPLAAAMPLRREREPDAPADRGQAPPSIEIYLDTSGSMPDPGLMVNAMTLAAQILSAAAIRAGGRVKAIVWSSGPPMCSAWMSSEETARDFLLNYSGGGTAFPFDVLTRNAEARADVIRVVVSDLGFSWNLDAGEAETGFLAAVRRSRLFVALLEGWGEQSTAVMRAALAEPNFEVVGVADGARLAAGAARLARALFDVAETARLG